MKSLLRDYVGLEDGMSKDDVEMKFLAKVSEEYRGVVNHWLSLGFEYELPQVSSAEELERVRMDAMVALLQNKEPTMVVLSDVHWADEASMKKFSLLQERLTENLLFVTNYRTTELPEKYRGYVEGETLTVDKFDVAGTKALLEYRLAGVDEAFKVDKGLSQLVWEHSKGVALHIAEITTYLEQEACIDDGKLIVSKERAEEKLREVPTLEKVVLARFRRLPKEQQELLKFVSAMYGEELSVELLSNEMLGDGLDGQEDVISEEKREEFDELLTILQAKEFLRRENGTIGFNHKLTQRAIYESIHVDHRRELHLEHVTRREKTSEDRLQEFIEELAWQASRTTDKRRRVLYNGQVTEKHIDTRNIVTNFSKGIKHADDVLGIEYESDWSDEQKAMYLRTMLLRGWVSFSNLSEFDEAIAIYDSVLERLDDILDQTEREIIQYKTHWNKADLLTGLRRAEDAIHHWDQAEIVGDRYMEDDKKSLLCLRKSYCYEGEEKLELLRKGLHLARQAAGDQSTPALSKALSEYVLSSYNVGNKEEAEVTLSEALEVAQDLNDSMSLVPLYQISAFMQRDQGNLESAIQLLHLSEEHAEIRGGLQQRLSVYVELAQAYADASDPKALDYLDKINENCTGRLREAYQDYIDNLEKEVKSKLGQN